MKRIVLFGAGAGALLGLACGGGGDTPPPSPPPASKLVYTDPADASGWRLMRNSSSTQSRLVLDLLAPAGASGRGVTVVLTANPGLVGWQRMDGTSFVKNLAYGGDLVQKASVSGRDLRVLLSQKPGVPVAYGAKPVLSVALGLKGDAPTGSVAVRAAQASHLGAATAPESMTVAVGSLQVQ